MQRTELLVTIANIVTDVCMLCTAAVVLRTTAIPLRAGLLLAAMAAVTLSAAGAHLAAIAYISATGPFVGRLQRAYSEHQAIAQELLTLLTYVEGLMVVIVSCMPGLRSSVRKRSWVAAGGVEALAARAAASVSPFSGPVAGGREGGERMHGGNEAGEWAEKVSQESGSLRE